MKTKNKLIVGASALFILFSQNSFASEVSPKDIGWGYLGKVYSQYSQEFQKQDKEPVGWAYLGRFYSDFSKEYSKQLANFSD